MSEYWTRLSKLDKAVYVGSGSVMAVSIGLGAWLGSSNLTDGMIVLFGGLVASLAIALIPTVHAAFVKKKVGDLETEVDRQLDKKWTPGNSKIRGVEIYDKPWYILAGEPSTGKTTAIKKAALPPSIDSVTGKLMHDPLQGEGGTENFDWWFFQNAVLLDTAGRLVSEPGPAWKLFLQKVRESRPGMPINGMILAISAEELIVPPPDIAERAATLANQLHVARLVLGVRFPVYVMITKTDKIAGFTEFFPDGGNPTAHFQILGWSNPENPLEQETGFDPTSIVKHLGHLAATLKRRRQALLTTPPQVDAESSRRIDQLDQLYSFPENIQTISANLRLYLEALFPLGQSLESFPAFFRGVYFTSSLRSGEALDKDLQSAFDLPQLPKVLRTGSDRPLFVRDLFLQKIFGEAGLVAPLENVKQGQSKRKIMVLSGGIAAAAILLLATFLGVAKLKDTILDHANFWHDVKTVADTDPAKLCLFNGAIYQGDATVAGQQLLDLHEQGLDLAQRPLHFWLFSIADPTGTIDSTRARVHHLLFERGVVEPVVYAAAHRLADPQRPWSPDSDDEALLTLVRLVHAGDGAAPPAPGDLATKLLLPGADMKALSDWLSTPGYVLRGCSAWPPSDFQSSESADTSAPPSRLAQETALALKRWNGFMQSDVVDAGNKIVSFVRDTLAAHDAEKKFVGMFYDASAKRLPLIPHTDQEYQIFVGDWTKQLQLLAEQVDQLKANAPAAVKGQGLAAAWDSVSALAKASTARYGVIESELAGAPSGPGAQWLKGQISQLQTQLEGAVQQAQASRDQLFAGRDLPDEDHVGSEMLGTPDWKISTRLSTYNDISDRLGKAGDTSAIQNFTSLQTELPNFEAQMKQDRSKYEANVAGDGDFASQRTALVDLVLNCAACARRSALLLAGSRDADAAWASPAKVLALSTTAVASLPPVPLVNQGQPIEIDPQFQPENATQWITAWTGIKRPNDDDCLNSQEVNDNLDKGLTALNDYVKRYAGYWEQTIPAQLNVGTFNWSDLPSALAANKDGAAINASLGNIDQTVRNALSVDVPVIAAATSGKNDPWASYRTSPQANGQQADQLGDNLCTGWHDLAATGVDSARQSLLGSSDMASNLTQPVGDGLVQQYWAQLNSHAVEALNRAFGPIRAHVMKGLAITADDTFPFEKSGSKTATLEDAKSFTTLVRRLRPEGSEHANEVVRALRDGAITKADVQQLDRYELLLPWLGAPPVSATIRLRNPEGTRLAYLQLVGNGMQADILSAENDRFRLTGQELGSPFPGGLTICAWQAGDLQNPQSAYVCNDFGDMWALLRMLSIASPHPVDDKPGATELRFGANCKRQGDEMPVVFAIEPKGQLTNPYTPGQRLSSR